MTLFEILLCLGETNDIPADAKCYFDIHNDENVSKKV